MTHRIDPTDINRALKQRTAQLKHARCGGLLALTRGGLVCTECDAKVLPVDARGRKKIESLWPGCVVQYRAVKELAGLDGIGK